jgi:ArsR family transcriptional regulator, arsenate/arsenite/antimonite-responsive transcriptional repressor
VRGSFRVAGRNALDTRPAPGYHYFVSWRSDVSWTLQEGNSVKEFMAAAKALADENRVRVLLFLRDRELCLCQIVEMLGLAPSTVSKHMAVLYQAGLVESRKDGRWMYYRLPGTGASPVVRGALRWVTAALDADPQVAADSKHLSKVSRMPKEDLCACYSKE